MGLQHGYHIKRDEGEGGELDETRETKWVTVRLRRDES